MSERIIILATVFFPAITIAQSPGIVVGTTRIDQQSVGSTGNRIAVGSDGSVFFTWMNALTGSGRPRHIYFNRVDSQGNWFSNGFGDRVSNDSVGGYCQVSMYDGNFGAVVYHGPANTYVKLAIDSDPPGYGIFNYYNPPDLLMPGNRHALWPYVAVDRNNRIHITMTESTTYAGDPKRFTYTRSANNGISWSDIQVIDSVKVNSGLVAASPVSDKVVIAYTRMVDTSIQLWNDVYYVLSQDGVNWDFSNGRVNVTNYASDNDSLWAFTDLALIFDYNDNFHIAWNANWSSTPDAYNKKTFLFHYNNGTQTINQIRSPWPDYNWPDSGCAIGAWNRPICKMDFGVMQAGNILFAIWTQFDSLDCSAHGFANGDIWAAWTANEGVNWNLMGNLTNSHTPGCTSGNCDNDNWGSLADIVDRGMQIFYVNSKSEGNDGSVPSQMCYYYNSLGISHQTTNPREFQLNQNYPNPFNSRTTISFAVQNESELTLDIYNIIGEKVANLFKGRRQPGNYKIIWDAHDVSSGVYYVVLSSENNHQTRKIILLK